MVDKLEQLFILQRKFQERMKNFPIQGFKHKQELININILACFDELSEVMRETAWKNPDYIVGGWKQGQLLNHKKFKEEIIDLWHFVINLTLISGMGDDELYGRFLVKNKENHERQDKEY